MGTTPYKEMMEKYKTVLPELKKSNKRVKRIVLAMNVDFKLLREQKQTLLEVMNVGLFKKEPVEHIAGVINMIDDMQDYAVDEAGFEHEDIFGKENNDVNRG